MCRQKFRSADSVHTTEKRQKRKTRRFCRPFPSPGGNFGPEKNARARRKKPPRRGAVRKGGNRPAARLSEQPPAAKLLETLHCALQIALRGVFKLFERKVPGGGSLRLSLQTCAPAPSPKGRELFRRRAPDMSKFAKTWCAR